MNKNQLTRNDDDDASSRALSHIAAAGARQSVLGVEKLNDFAESPRMPPALDDASDWPEQEGDGAAYLGSRYSEHTDDALAPEVESGINLLLHGVSYR
jgi:hypothetical protein